MGVLEERMVKSSKFWLDLSFKVVTPLKITQLKRESFEPNLHLTKLLFNLDFNFNKLKVQKRSWRCFFEFNKIVAKQIQDPTVLELSFQVGWNW